jgi:hypothetical protein
MTTYDITSFILNIICLSGNQQLSQNDVINKNHTILLPIEICWQFIFSVCVNLWPCIDASAG